MNSSLRSTVRSSFRLFLFAALLVNASGQTPTTSGRAEVRGILGRARVAPAGGAFTVLSGGAVLTAGSIIETASESAVDLYLGPAAGILRLTQGTTVVIEKLNVTGQDWEVELDLRQGELLGKASSVPGSKLMVKTATSLSVVGEGQFRFSARGYVVLLNGKILVGTSPVKGEPVTTPLVAPPAVYFSPMEGVRPAPPALVGEVKNQTRSKLPKG